MLLSDATTVSEKTWSTPDTSVVEKTWSTPDTSVVEKTWSTSDTIVSVKTWSTSDTTVSEKIPLSRRRCGLPLHSWKTSSDNIVTEPGGPTEHTPPPPPGTFHYGPKMYLRVSRTQCHLFPGQPLGCTRVTALCARVPSCIHPGTDRAQVTNRSFESLVHHCFVT